ncbi:N-acetyltransferase [Kibdelosporangium philippinense]|uniref:N-acetyltransferase n=1 Tax=Kibdelosporangium philippinense TaxID=211113 RepID=A0ABS8Z883_9PSEU|nr:N-acetyltransferase [Kibdelosporangium philippinense]MCE7004101.1 N-acetyltransferase [Kibdelosporangium philippinense]
MWVCREQPGDVALARAVHVEAFGQELEASLLDALRASDAWIDELSFVVRFGVEVAGHVVVTRAHVDDRPVLALGPIGVLPRFHGQGLGSALMHTVLGAADALGEPLVGLLGDPRFYERFGFELGAMMHVLPPDPDWLQHFQVRRLSAYKDKIQGTFRYAAPFDEV